MNREEAKKLFRDDKDAYGKPRGIMGKLNKIFDEFEQEKLNWEKEKEILLKEICELNTKK